MFVAVNPARFAFISIALSSLLALSACAPQTLEKLPDDPAVEAPSQNPVPGGEEEPTPNLPPEEETKPIPGESSSDALILEKYAHLDPQKLIPRSLLNPAILYFDKNASMLKNKNYITIIDFSQSSSRRRMFIITVQTGAVWALTVSHGKGSDSNHDGYAEKFSNVSGSNASSLGFYITAETYQGSNGYSLRLDGKSSTNSNARPRAIVVHGASYVQDREVIQGRSWGCPAVANEYRDRVINMIKGGSLMYAERSAK